MNKTIYQTIALALCDYKTYWNKKINSYDKKHGSISIEAKDICLDKIKDITQSLEYLNDTYSNEPKKSTNSMCEFIKFFQNEIKLYNVFSDKVFLTDVQIRELHKIHNNDKVKINWCRQPGKDTVVLSYLVYLAQERGQRILIDAPNYSQRKDMMDKIYSMSNSSFYPSHTLKFTGGGYITTSALFRNKFDVLFSNEYDYNSAPMPLFTNSVYGFKKIIVVSKELNDCDFVESKINWNEIPGRDECFKQRMIESIGLDDWYKEYEVHEVNDEFTASNMRKLLKDKNHEANMMEIDNIKEHIKKQCDICIDFYLYKYSMNEFISQYFRSLGFKIEHDFKCFDKTYTKISW